MNKYIKYILLILFAVAIALGIYQWQYNPKTFRYLQKQESERDSLGDYIQFDDDDLKGRTAELTFLAVGDIMLSRNVAATMSKAGKDGFLPFRKMEDVLSTTDFNFGNLESPFSGRDDFNSTGSLVFNAPTWAMPGLAQYNFKVLNLANNHAMDQEKAGLLYTKKYLAENYLKGIGTGNNLDEAWQGDTYTADNITVGFIGASYSTLNDNGVATNPYVARIEDVAHLRTAVANMKTKANFIVVTMHAGTEYTRAPNQSQIGFAHAAIDAGADMVMGAHAHWIQTNEVYKGKYIFYGLGNFVFDQEWSQETKEGLTLKITLNKTTFCQPGSSTSQPQAACVEDLQGQHSQATLKQIELIPVIIENYSTPRPASESEKAAILKKIGATNSIIAP